MSSEAPGGEYAQRARRMAEEAARRAAAPLRAVRQQKEDLESAREELHDLQAALAAARLELDRVEGELALARRNADLRRAPDAVEAVIETALESAVETGSELTAPALRDLGLAVADLDVNRVMGTVVVVDDDSPVRAVVVAAAGPERAVLRCDVADCADLALDEPIALGYLAVPGYAPLLACLQRVAPLLVSGGRLVVPGYATSPVVRSAVDAYFRDRRMDFRFEQQADRHVVRR